MLLFFVGAAATDAASCGGLRTNHELVTMQSFYQIKTATPEECCAAMSNTSLAMCHMPGLSCKYFTWKDPTIYPFPSNCQFYHDAGNLIPDTDNDTTVGWLAGVPEPTLGPPPSKVFSGNYIVSPDKLGLQFDGIGAISGGGATSKLLMDYEPKVVSDILDYMFTPNFGLSLQILKVEIGCDMDATEGAESSHMHSASDPGNYQRGYEWWLMKEAKKRNPDIKLYGLSWGFPGWLNPNATAHARADPNIIFSDSGMPNVANYTVQWLKGAKREHGLDIDYLGLWNERSPPAAYANVLHDAVVDAGFGDTTTVLGKWPIAHYGGSGIHEDSQNCTQYPWKSNNSNASVWMDEDGSIADGRNARCLARIVNRNYVNFCKTATIQWHLISSFYDYFDWARCGVAVANQPWSGDYEITSSTWVLAHTTQFSPIGWRYAGHFRGVQMLAGGGSVVTRVSPDEKDFSIILEKMDASISSCARGNNPQIPVNPEKITLQLQGKFAEVKQLQVWHSNMTTDDIEYGSNPTPENLFIKKDPIQVGPGGKVSLMMLPNDLYTLTTITTGNKGSHDQPSAGKRRFSALPLPYKQTFDDETNDKPGKYWYTQMGAFEIQPSSTGDGNELRQMSTVWPNCWNSHDCDPPKVWFGPEQFNDKNGMSVSMDILLKDSGNITFSLAPYNAQQAAQKAAASVTLCTNGTWSVGTQTSDKGLSLPVGKYTRIQLVRSNGFISASVAGAILANVSVPTTGPASAAGNFTLKVVLSHYYTAAIDNFNVETPN